MKNKKYRVFFHELGHFVANEINHVHFGVSQVKKIKLTKHYFEDSIDYTGETIYKVPAGEDKNKPLENLPPKLANLIYGCYFQSLYLNTELKDCFDYSNQDANGSIDMNNTISALTQFQVSSDNRKDFYPFIEQQYFKELSKRKSDFNIIFNLNPEEYFLEINKTETEVDLAKLKTDISTFIEGHKEVYLNFILEISRILEWNKLKKLPN